MGMSIMLDSGDVLELEERPPEHVTISLRTDASEGVSSLITITNNDSRTLAASLLVMADGPEPVPEEG